MTQRRLLETDDRQPVRFLNYASRVTPDPQQPLGPSTLGEQLWPVTVEEVDGGGCRVGLSYIAPTSEKRTP